MGLRLRDQQCGFDLYIQLFFCASAGSASAGSAGAGSAGHLFNLFLKVAIGFSIFSIAKKSKNYNKSKEF